MKKNGETGGEGESLTPLWEQATFGREVQEFIEADRIGQYLVDRARDDLDKARDALVSVDPTETKTIIKLQLDARVAMRVRSWLSEAIETGQAARVTLEQERDEHGT